MNTYFRLYIDGNQGSTQKGTMDPSNHQKVGDTASELLRVMQSTISEDAVVTVHATFDGPVLCSYTRNQLTGTVTGTPA